MNSIILVGLTIFTISFVLGEFIVPVVKKLKAEIQLSIGETRDFTLTDKGFWARNQNIFFKVDTLQSNHTVIGVELYEFNDEMELLSILTADCVPVLFADPAAELVGAAHAGWRGAVGGILAATVSLPPCRCRGGRVLRS